LAVILLGKEIVHLVIVADGESALVIQLKIRGEIVDAVDNLTK
jgi:hypothetical protein